MMINLASPQAKRTLLGTVTGEPVQPVRLYYSLPNKSAATRILAELACMKEDPESGRWVWLYQAEVAELTFMLPHAEIPADAHPILIGTFRFPKIGGMVLQLRSFERAIAAARFFGPRLGPRFVLRRARVLNRFIEANEAKAGLDDIDGYLDRNVTVIDPRVGEARFKKFLAAGGRPSQTSRQNGDIPEVEDFPLAPQEETPEFFHLNMTLKLRSLRALEHWNGNTHLRLEDIIRRLLIQGKLEQPSF